MPRSGSSRRSQNTLPTPRRNPSVLLFGYVDSVDLTVMKVSEPFQDPHATRARRVEQRCAVASWRGREDANTTQRKSAVSRRGAS